MMIKYKIWNKETKKYEGVYSRAYHDEYEFSSEDSALNANCHDTIHNTDMYEIHQVEINEALKKILPPKEEHLLKTKKNKELNDRITKVMAEKNCSFYQAAKRVALLETVFKALKEKYKTP